MNGTCLKNWLKIVKTGWRKGCSHIELAWTSRHSADTNGMACITGQQNNLLCFGKDASVGMNRWVQTLCPALLKTGTCFGCNLSQNLKSLEGTLKIIQSNPRCCGFALAYVSLVGEDPCSNYYLIFLNFVWRFKSVILWCLLRHVQGSAHRKRTYRKHMCALVLAGRNSQCWGWLEKGQEFVWHMLCLWLSSETFIDVWNNVC